jgi:ornithine carbamoyltransferase
LNDYAADDILKIVQQALSIKKDPAPLSHALQNKVLYMLFQKTSTRTSLSFSLAMQELGGHYIIQKWEDSNFTVGDVMDETRYVSDNVDMIMARLKHYQDLALMAQYSTVPIINGCCEKYHPCQAVADMTTILELFGSFNIKMLYIGVYNNVFNSLLQTLPRLGGVLYGMTPIINQASLDQATLSAAKSTGRFFELSKDDDIHAIVHEMDALYVDTWIDMEFFNDPAYQAEKQRRLDVMLPYQINEALLKDSRAVVLHDMPIHAGFEITRPIIEANIQAILKQSQNRKHAQKAIMLSLL